MKHDNLNKNQQVAVYNNVPLFFFKCETRRVVDLRAELEKRGLDKNGVKAVLTERLQKVTRF
jgi:hypothetical protein